MEKINRLSLPVIMITVIISSLILGSFIYASQVNKQNSIERQLEDKQEMENLKLKQDECRSLSAGTMKRWNNIVGVTYNPFWGECEATYIDTKTKGITTSPLRRMRTVD